jgi:hypothetical protein
LGEQDESDEPMLSLDEGFLVEPTTESTERINDFFLFSGGVVGS